MNLRLRLFIAAAFAALFFLIPSPDTTSGRAYLGTLKVREWLLDADGPLQGYVADGALPPLAVEYRLSPPSAAVSPAAGEPFRVRNDYASSWQRSHSGSTAVADTNRARSRLVGAAEALDDTSVSWMLADL